MHSQKYREYLRSPEWEIRRKWIKALAGNKCERCGATIGLEVHHRTYERLGHELPDDLEVLCRRHHKEADEERKQETEDRIQFARVNGYMTKRYGENWQDCFDYDEAEERFEYWLERKEGW